MRVKNAAFLGMKAAVLSSLLVSSLCLAQYRSDGNQSRSQMQAQSASYESDNRYQPPENSPCAYAAQQITRAIVEADQRHIRPEQSETWQQLKSEPGLNGINLSGLLREAMDIKMNIANPTARDIFGGIEIACKRY